MLNKLKTLFRSGISNNEFKLLKESIEEVRNRYNYICFYGSPTGGNWLGIANATKSLYPTNAVEIPQHYSNAVLTDRQAIELCKNICQLHFEKVIISGFAPHFFKWIDKLHGTTSIEILYHGTISEFYGRSMQEMMKNLIVYGKEGKINRFGFIKKGLEEVFSTLYNFDTYHQPLPLPIIPPTITKLALDKQKIHIGIFGADTFNKNLHNQVIHALLIENTVLHVLDKSIFTYLQMDERIIEHGKNLSHDKFLSILGSMDLNLYMSFNESWGLVAYESEALGVRSIKLKETNYKEEIRNAILSNNKK